MPPLNKPALAARKSDLLRRAEVYRIGIVHAQAQVRLAAHPSALLHTALAQARALLHARADGWLAPTGLQLDRVLPYAFSALAWTARRKLLKPVLLAGLALSGLAALLTLRRKRRAP